MPLRPADGIAVIEPLLLEPQMTETPNPPQDTPSDRQSPGKRPPPLGGKLGRPPAFIVLMLSAIVVAIAGWSAIWYFGTQKAEEMALAWLAAEAEAGRVYSCAERAVGGYPFRVSLVCDEPSLALSDAEPRVRATGVAFRAVAQVWNPTHVIFEIDGPVRIETGAPERPGAAIDAKWQLLQGSLRAPEGRIRRLDIAVTDLEAKPDPATLGPGGGMLVEASSAGFHGRSRSGANPGGRDVDVAVDVSDLVVTAAGSQPPAAVDIRFVGRLDALPASAPRDLPAFLSAWRDNDGGLAVDRMSALQGETELRASGTLTSDGEGYPAGSVTVALAGPDVTTPGSAGAFGGLAPLMVLGLRLAGESGEIDGRTALTGDLDLRGGNAYFGAIPVTKLPRLY